MKHEWTLLSVFFLIIASFVFISKVNASRAVDAIGQIDEEPRQILVMIDGAVKKPGQYWVSEGTLVESVLRKSRPSPYADLKLQPLKEIVTNPLHLTVAELKEVKVSVSGAVLESLELVMPVGSRISDLKSKITFTSETDKSFFRRRKLLKDGDKIEVPKKTVEQN